MRIYIFILFLSSIPSFGLSQVSIVINELKVSNIYPKFYDNIYEEGEDDGPYIHMDCSLLNETETDIHIYPSEAEICFYFNCDSIEYYCEYANTLPFKDNKELVVKSKESVDFRAGILIVLGTPMWAERKTDYSKDLLKILPTIRLRYRDVNIDCYSTQIKRVVISE